MMLWCYKHQTEEHTPKILIKFGIGDEEQRKFTEAERQIQFEALAQVRAHIMNWIKAYQYFGRNTGKITPDNFEGMMQEDMKKFEAAYRTEVI